SPRRLRGNPACVNDEDGFGVATAAASRHAPSVGNSHSLRDDAPSGLSPAPVAAACRAPACFAGLSAPVPVPAGAALPAGELAPFCVSAGFSAGGVIACCSAARRA